MPDSDQDAKPTSGDLDETLSSSSSEKQLGYAACWDGYSRRSNPYTFSGQNADFLKGVDWDAGFKLAQQEQIDEFTMQYHVIGDDLVAEFDIDPATRIVTQTTHLPPKFTGAPLTNILKAAFHEKWNVFNARTGRQLKPDNTR